MSALDDSLGRLLDFLDETGCGDDTIVVYTADHGDMLWSHGLPTKMVPYEESVNVPFLIRWPGRIPAGERNETLLSTVDIAPTLSSLAGIGVPERMEGVDSADAIRNGRRADRDAVYMMRTTYPRYEWRSVRTQRYTYARLLDGSSWLLYDNDDDPYQQRNLVNEPAYADVRAELNTLIDERAATVDDPLVPGPELAERLDVLPELYAAWFDGNYDVPRKRA